MVVMLGPDSMVLSDSVGGAGGGACKLTPADDVDKPIGNPTPCHAKNNKGSSDTITTEFTNQSAADLLAADTAVPRAAPALQCKDDPLTGVVCPCVDSDLCKGNILITAEVTPATDLAFPFLASGPGVGNFSIRTDGMTDTEAPPCLAAPFGTGCTPFNNLVALVSDSWTFTAPLTDPTWTTIPNDSNHRYDVDSIDCTSLLNRPAFTDPITLITTPAYIVSTWEVDSSSVKTKAKVTRLGKGDTVTCKYHIHKTSG